GRGAYELVTQPNYTVSGRVTLFEGGAGLGGVTVRLANGQPSPPTAITDANGNYTISNVPGGVNYVLGASKPDYTFSPQVTIFENLSANQTVNFTARLACFYSVSPGSRQSFPASGGTGTINMTTRAGCEWKALSLDPWITITSGSVGTGNGTINFTVAPNSGNERFGQILHTDDSFYTITQAASPAPAFVNFSAPEFTASEGAGRAAVTVTRTGSTTNAISVDVVTNDDPASVPCATNNGTAYARCDYATTIETVTFAAGDTQPKTVQIPLIDDAHVEQAESVQVRLVNPANTALGTHYTAALTINDNGDAAGAPNPILQTPLFIRMQYLDFLSREPESGEPWSKVLNDCPNVNNNPACDRLTVSKSFFESPEFRLKGLYTFIFYRVAFNRLPEYAEIIPDMRSVTGQTASEVYDKRALFATNFALRAEFRTPHDKLSHMDLVNTLLDRYGLQRITTPDPQNPEGGVKVTLSRADLINRLSAQTLTRAQVLRAIVESDEIRVAEFNRAYVAMQYYGYLRRTPETGGYNNWLTYLNANPADARTMVNGFVNSAEYRARFGR
ncbi:MAG TPA: Calx-beta domain-containing protein, partial [Pyrinomonadaceae bacterium]|nr:Calx-beta domain-containing protein [Pyrinomonadaceae bacterium]